SHLFSPPKLLAYWLFSTKSKSLLGNILDDTDPKFAKWAIGASVAWTSLLLGLTWLLGERLLPLLGPGKGIIAVVVVVGGLVFLVGRQARRWAEASARSNPDRTRSSFEFWPPFLFYIPVALKILTLGLRYRSLTVATAANPSIHAGGLINESKSAVLDLIPEDLAEWLPTHVTATGGESREQVLDRVEAAGLHYPLVAKPDLGQRGAGVRRVEHPSELASYLESFPAGARFMVQALVDHPHEAGIFYYRRPDRERGEILSVTLKEFPFVEGDGRSTLKALIHAHPRARHAAAIYERRHQEHLLEILPEGRRFSLVFAGNHSQGAVFRNGQHILTPALVQRIDEIAHRIPGFYFGRFDLRFSTLEAFQRGEGFRIIELNGVGAEATHIWDPNAKLLDAYRDLFRQFELAYAIGAANRARGVQPRRFLDLVKDAVAYFRLARAYPPAT
ncbi:MAG: hypothetical protein AAFU79_16140, partial [Myxococcota bacterium]